MSGSQYNIITALAPMRDIINRQFCDLFTQYGEPNFYVTEFLRVHSTSNIDKNIEDLIKNRISERPLIVQLLGREPKNFIRIAKILEQYNIAGINLNFGCPMPKIHKKGTGGILLNEPGIIESIIASLKEDTSLSLSVKMRIGFSDNSTFDQILSILSRYELANVTIHARTVRGLYRESVNYDYVKQAREKLSCQILANGDINTAEQAFEIIKFTGCDGVMIGRAAIRNPFIFKQIKNLIKGENLLEIKLYDIYSYITKLIKIAEELSKDETKQVCLMKKYLNFIGQCIDENGEFLHDARRASTKQELCLIVEKYIKSRANEKFHETPYKNILARPNCE